MTSSRAAQRIAPALRNAFDSTWANLTAEIVCQWRPKASHVDVTRSVHPCESGEDGAVPAREDVYKACLLLLVQEVIDDQRISRAQGRELLAELAAKEN